MMFHIYYGHCCCHCGPPLQWTRCSTLTIFIVVAIVAHLYCGHGVPHGLYSLLLQLWPTPTADKMFHIDNVHCRCHCSPPLQRTRCSTLTMVIVLAIVAHPYSGHDVPRGLWSLLLPLWPTPTADMMFHIDYGHCCCHCGSLLQWTRCSTLTRFIVVLLWHVPH